MEPFTSPFTRLTEVLEMALERAAPRRGRATSPFVDFVFLAPGEDGRVETPEDLWPPGGAWAPAEVKPWLKPVRLVGLTALSW